MNRPDSCIYPYQVIQVLDDSKRQSIEYANRMWLLQSIEILNIKVNEIDCNVDAWSIVESWYEKGRMVVQSGSPIYNRRNFLFGKEAILLKHSDNGCYVYLYSPTK